MWIRRPPPAHLRTHITPPGRTRRKVRRMRRRTDMGRRQRAWRKDFFSVSTSIKSDTKCPYPLSGEAVNIDRQEILGRS